MFVYTDELWVFGYFIVYILIGRMLHNCHLLSILFSMHFGNLEIGTITRVIDYPLENET